MTTATLERPAAAVTARSTAFVVAHRDRAREVGHSLGDAIGEPEAFATALRRGLAELADPEYHASQLRVAPGIGPMLGVRSPLLGAVSRGLRAATRRDRPATLLAVADRLLREPYLEARWLAFDLFGRLLRDDPERTWQLMRRAAREAADWITVDTLARAYAAGILDAPYRWAELEQLVYSPSRWERRLVGSTIATIPFVDRERGRTTVVAATGLGILARLIGDREPDVQKALSWAYRSLAGVDPAAASVALRHETELASADGDGHRAWVIRDSISKLPPVDAARLRARLTGLRRTAGAASTSEASAMAARFGELPDPRNHPEPPLR